MKNDVKVLLASDVPRLSPEEIKARLQKDKREYRKELNAICPSADIRALAKRIAKRNDSCTKCVYFGGYFCLYPHSDGYIEDREIDPCYEGVLRFLRKDMGGLDDSDAAKLRKELADAEDAVCNALETTISICELYGMNEGGRSKSKLDTASFVKLIQVRSQEIVDDLKAAKERNEVNSHNETEAKTL